MFSDFDFRAILAMDSNGTIGKGDSLPWCKEMCDMKRFRDLTLGHTVLMGRNTWDSLPDEVRPLPNRQNIILTHDISNVKGAVGDNTHIITSIGDLKKHVKPHSRVFLIGGGTMYDNFIKDASVVHLTEFMHTFDGDVKLGEETLRYINNDMPIIVGSSVSYMSDNGYEVNFMDLGVVISESIW